MVGWFRDHVVVQKLALYLAVAAMYAYFLGAAWIVILLTVAFVLGDGWVFTFLPAGWDPERARVSTSWLVIGVLLGSAVTGPLWFTVVVLAVVAVVVAARHAKLRRTLDAGVPLSLAAASAWLAWANRSGPGTVCRADADCQTYFSPWPFAVVAVVLVFVTFAVERRRARSGATPRS